jgi:hypothetical protein
MQSGYLGREHDPTGKKIGTAGAETAWLALTKAEMTKAGSTGGPAGPGAAKRQERAERLSAALKANLGRRKAQAREKQARERAAEAGQPRHDHDPEPAREPMDDPLNKAPPDKAS